jgi:CBS domain-containing protein
MAVKAILDTKGIDVAIIEPTADLAFAVKLLAARAIGALVVVGPDQQVAGIISERDIIRIRAGQARRWRWSSRSLKK